MSGKPLVWLYRQIKTPPFSVEALMRTGFLLRELQDGEMLSMPDSRPMPTIGRRCHELRVDDKESGKTWRIVYRLDPDAVVIVEVFVKKTNETPKKVIEVCKRRLKQYDSAAS